MQKSVLYTFQSLFRSYHFIPGSYRNISWELLTTLGKPSEVIPNSKRLMTNNMVNIS